MIASESRNSLATRVLLVLGLLAALSALAPPLLAAAEQEGSSGQTTTGEPTTPSSESAPGDKRAPGTKGAPGSNGTPGGKDTPGSKGGTGKKPAPLSFTDDDLKAYRPPVVEETPVEEPVVLLPLPPRPRPAGTTSAGAPKPASPGPTAATKPAGPGPSAAPKPGVTGKPAVSSTQATKGTVQTSAPVTFAPSPAVLNPPKRKKPPAPPDPLAPFKQREAQEQFRAGQIQGLRDQIGALETRLAYLKQKRIAIVDPLNIMPQSQTDEDRQADVSLKPRDLLQQVETEISATEAQLETTRTTLAEIQIRFGAEAGNR